jgi:hypothetical protein
MRFPGANFSVAPPISPKRERFRSGASVIITLRAPLDAHENPNDNDQLIYAGREGGVFQRENRRFPLRATPPHCRWG